MLLILAIVDLLLFLIGGELDGRFALYLVLGFAYGQAATAAIWVFFDRNHRRGLTLLLMEVVALAIGSVVSRIDYGELWIEHFITLLRLLLYTHLMLGFMLLGHLLRHLLRRWQIKEQPLWFPQFRMVHLLIAMLATAVLASLLRITGNYFLEELFTSQTILAYSLLALLGAAGGTLLLNSPLRLWRLGLFAALTILAYYLFDWFIFPEKMHVFLTANTCTIAAILLIPRLDRYQLLDGHAPRGGPAEEVLSDENLG
ncbi:hypothetical protein [Aeoliella mucimassa]|nr:hypothetical protein [Aeoliella mucimassa]